MFHLKQNEGSDLNRNGNIADILVNPRAISTDIIITSMTFNCSYFKKLNVTLIVSINIKFFETA